VVRLSFSVLAMAVTPQLVVGVGLAAFTSCTLASLVAVRRVLLTDPAIVFRG
jgi:ABC-type lipoprotein release transport system permease subunit